MNRVMGSVSVLLRPVVAPFVNLWARVSHRLLYLVAAVAVAVQAVAVWRSLMDDADGERP